MQLNHRSFSSSQPLLTGCGLLIVFGSICLLGACVPQPDEQSAPQQEPFAPSTIPELPSTTTPSTTPSESSLPSAVNLVTGRIQITTGPLNNLWVNPQLGNDASAGNTEQQALRTIAEAWRRIPASTTLTRGYHIWLQPGTYPPEELPSYLEHRWGTAQAPIILQSSVSGSPARLTGDLNIFDTQHLYLIELTIDTVGDSLHCEKCSNLLVRHSQLLGNGAAQEVIKINQSDHIYIEDSEVTGAWDNAIDFVAVNTGHLLGNEIHDAGDWCGYVKGGSAAIRVDGNEIHHCGTGGFTAGQGSGFEFMVAPWLQYEAYGISVTNNLIHDTDGAGVGVNGGYNILIAYNTLYKVGARSHAVEFVAGRRGCDGDTARCAEHRQQGGWGTTGIEGQWIPNRHIVFANNIVYNPTGFATQWQHFEVAGPAIPATGSGVPSPARADDDLRIYSNIIFNGSTDMPLGFDLGCAASNPSCNEALVRANNAINTIEPLMIDPSHDRWELTQTSPARSLSSTQVAEWSWADAPTGIPSVTAPNSSKDRAGVTRQQNGPPGAYSQ